MSKERLEELEDLFEDISNDMKPPYVGISLDTIVDVKWLIKYAKEQAERVEELERLEKSFDELDSDYIDTKKENEALAETRRLDAVENVRLWEENQRYKQALETIAQETGTPYADIAIKALAGDTE